MVDKADVLIVTVTEVESRAVMKAFRKVGSRDPKPEPIGDRFYLDFGEINGTRVFMALSEMGSGGVGGSQKSVDKGIEALSPAAVIMVGVAFGVNEKKQSLGDVLVSHQLWLYDLQRIGEDRIVPRGDKPHASSWLINWLQVAQLSWDAPKAKIRFGVLLSGEKLLDNIDYRNQLKQFEPEAIGGEMEGAGLYVASQDKKVDWVLVKGICDWADGHKVIDKESRQRLAAQNAATFVSQALQHACLKRVEKAPIQEKLTPAMGPEPSTVVPSSLPSQSSFFGRQRELDTIAEAIAPEARTWGVLVDGPGGVGKTALAIRAAHIASHSHFDRKIFLSAKVRDLTPQGEQELEDFKLADYMALLTELARELGDDNIEHTDPKERPNALRRTLTGMRVLIVIDNVETFLEPERVRLYQFLSRLPTTCKAIVTSRHRADIDARVIRLDRMGLTDALNLLAELAKNNRHLQKASQRELRDLYELTNGNPLLLKWTAGQLGRRGSQCHSVNEACEFLKTATSGNDPLEYIFGDLLNTFTESETIVLAALVHFKEPTKVQCIADVTGLNENVALTALEDLTDRALLLSDEQTFHLPILAASFLRRKRPEVIVDIGHAISDLAYTLILENGYRHFERFGTLESAWPIITAALPLLLMGDNSRLQRTCDALRYFLEFSGRWDEWTALSGLAEEKAVASNDLFNAGWRAYDSGWIYYLRKNSESVLACAARCASHWQGSPRAGFRETAVVIRLRGNGHRLEKNYSAAVGAYKEALEMFCKSASASEDIADALSSLALVEQAQGNRPSAERYYREALQTAEAVNDKEGVAIITGNLATLEHENKNWLDAERLARHALELSEQVGRQELVGSNCFRLAKTLVTLNRFQEAFPYAKRAVEIFAHLRQPEQSKSAQALLRRCRR